MKINSKIGVLGAYGESNFGDDALMFYLNEWFKKQGIQVIFIGKENDYVNQLLPEGNYITKEESRECFDVLILGGGTQAFSFRKKNFLQKGVNIFKNLILNPKNGYQKLKRKISSNVLSENLKEPKIIGVGVGFGPFIGNDKAKIKTQELIKGMESVYVRDRFSYDFARPYNNQTYQFTDICYIPNDVKLPIKKGNGEEIKNIGIIVRDWVHDDVGNKYYTVLQENVEWLRKQGYKVTYVLFKDEKYWGGVVRNENEKHLQWNPSKQSIEEFLELLSCFDLFISARFHGAIFGALLGIPSIPIEVEQKLCRVSEMIYHDEFVWRQPFLSHDFKNLFRDFENRYEQILSKIDHTNSINKSKALEMFNSIMISLR